MRLFICSVLIVLAAAQDDGYGSGGDGGHNGGSPPAPGSGCGSFPCGSGSKCYEVGDSSCDSPDCPKTPRCIAAGQITCDNVRCAGPCVMIAQAGSYGGKGVAVPICFPPSGHGDNYGKKGGNKNEHNGGYKGGDGDHNGGDNGDDNGDHGDNNGGDNGNHGYNGGDKKGHGENNGPLPGSGCGSFLCAAGSKCYEVGDSSCESPDCPKTAKCIANGQITCDNVRCSGPCVMVLQAGSYGGKGIPTPQCFPGNDSGHKPSGHDNYGGKKGGKDSYSTGPDHGGY